MQHPGAPAEPRQGEYAARHAPAAVFRTFQIKSFSAGLKNRVMVMDFVKSNWFPSQKRAKVCIIRMYQGLKAAEQPASRYEIHSRLFAPPDDHAAWAAHGTPRGAGSRDDQYSTNDPITLKNLHSDVTEKKSDFAKETLASQDTKMLSSVVISQLIDESGSGGRGAALSVPCALAQPLACPRKPSLANDGPVTVDRAFAGLPSPLGMEMPMGTRGPETELPPRDKPCSDPQKGFASITITARRVGPPASTLVWGAVGDPPCAQCRARDALLRDPSALAHSAAPCRHNGPFACTELSRNSSVIRLKFPEAHARLCEEHWVTNVGCSGSRFSAGTPQPGKSPLVFSSCVHLRVSQQCPNSIYYLDRSLSVPLEQPQLAGPKVHRSVLSLNLSCSSHRLTPDGVDGPANRGPLSGARKPALTQGGRDLLGPRWSPGVQASFFKESPPLGRVHLGTGACPWSGSPPVGNAERAEVGTHQVTVRKREQDQATQCHTNLHAKQLSIHIPGWSYTAGDYTCCDLVLKIKECKHSEAPATPEPPPAAPTPAPTKGPGTPDLQEDCSECQHARASTLTLQEALEARKPQFISRSQERLKKLERMVQQRRAQQTEPRSLLPVHASKKQFTVPHPLSDNLFKPKERSISEKEMHMRSKRIYNNLPEVRKRKEEQKKRVVLQSNRLRAEVFKKQLLDQLLQRNAV